MEVPMETTAVGSAGLGRPTLDRPENVSMEKEAFLKLLVAQISNQDPMQPQQSEQYMQQLTQFSTLEQLMNLNDGVSSLAVGQLSNNSQEALRFVGRDVTARGDAFDLAGEGSAELRYDLPEDAADGKVTIRITDEAGEVVREIERPAQAGPQSVLWDGVGDDGARVPQGRYHVSVEATDAEGDALPVDTFVRGTVSGVRFDQGFPELMVGERRIRLSDITEVH